mmetsp:Transcript_5666/g.19702  ORF Transcript_5666/g.19702 Transcript_5666/m.19702 type:complete len:448 (+) Transcript_5666:316-1659(+)
MWDTPVSSIAFPASSSSVSVRLNTRPLVMVSSPAHKFTSFSLRDTMLRGYLPTATRDLSACIPGSGGRSSLPSAFSLGFATPPSPTVGPLLCERSSFVSAQSWLSTLHRTWKHLLSRSFPRRSRSVTTRFTLKSSASALHPFSPSTAPFDSTHCCPLVCSGTRLLITRPSFLHSRRYRSIPSLTVSAYVLSCLSFRTSMLLYRLGSTQSTGRRSEGSKRPRWYELFSVTSSVSFTASRHRACTVFSSWTSQDGPSASMFCRRMLPSILCVTAFCTAFTMFWARDWRKARMPFLSANRESPCISSDVGRAGAGDSSSSMSSSHGGGPYDSSSSSSPLPAPPRPSLMPRLAISWSSWGGGAPWKRGSWNTPEATCSPAPPVGSKTGSGAHPTLVATSPVSTLTSSTMHMLGSYMWSLKCKKPSLNLGLAISDVVSNSSVISTCDAMADV